MNKSYLVSAILLMALATFMTRSAPFIFLKKFQDSPWIQFIGKYLPASVMLLLVVYCVRETNIVLFPYGFPEASSILIVVLLHLWRRNVLLSIGLGTAFYVVLIQTEALRSILPG